MIGFSDKYTGKKYNAGEIIEVTAKRFNEIMDKGKFLRLVEDDEKGDK